jgi:hypothetical protein
MLLRVLTFLVFLSISWQVCGQIRVAKVSLSSAAVGALGVAFEKVHDKQFSWQLGIVYRPEYSGPDFLLQGGESEFELASSRTNGLAFHGEYRFYTNKARQQPVKPYIAVYLQHGLLGLQANYRKESFEYAFNADWNYTTLGIQYGIQWILRERYAVDLTLVGFGVNRNSLAGTVQMDPEASVGFFEEHLSGIPQIGKRFGLEGKDGNYACDENFVGVSLRFVLRVGWLF